MAEALLPYGRQSIDQDDIDHVIEALRSDFLTTGPWVERFERELAQTVGAREAVAVSNGTAALHLAVLSQNLTPQDVVIVPSVTFVASANAVAFCGAQVVFADVDPDTGLMTEESFLEALAIVEGLKDHRFAGVIPVHYAGRPVDLAMMADVCAGERAFVIEDACHALGSKGPQGSVGACQASDMACFSFHPVKTLTTGEGGAITTDDTRLAEKLRQLRSHGLERRSDHFTGLGYGDADDQGAWVYEMQALGYNYRLPDINCALGVAQLAKLSGFVQRRRHLVGLYRDLLKTAGLPVTWTDETDSESAFHLMAVRIDYQAAGRTRSEVMAGLRERGIGTQVHYVPVHRQPWWAERQLARRDLSGADSFYRHTLSLPLFPDMTDADPARVVRALTEVLS
ncbi:MAG: UDP-4-amino-4,6-dideoxy-N-acetyl-beta-L-altrosamine transaminase [Asticcacaulis sp.]